MTEPQIGSIQLDRTVDSILVGTRHRADLGDIDALAASIDRDGLLQPLTITIDGVLVCGARRLAAIKKGREERTGDRFGLGRECERLG